MSKSRGGLVIAGVIALIAILWWTQRPSDTDTVHDKTSTLDGSNARQGSARAAKLPNAPIRGGNRIAGIVLRDGAAVADAIVSVNTERGNRPIRQTKTDASGHFDLGEHAPAELFVVAERPGATRAPGTTVKLTIERDDKERTITLTLGAP